MNEAKKKHTFVICAYKESSYLEECVKSLKNQNQLSNILMVTSTPNEYIEKISRKYGIELKINTGQGGIVQDWNFAYRQCKTPYITIAHQDDIYFKDYAARAIKMLEQSKKPLIYFSDYCEIRNGQRVTSNRLLQVKRILLFPLRGRLFKGSTFVRRRSLSLGSAICCPAVTYAANNLPDPVFTVRYRSDEDWEAWERISKLKGDFLYDSTIQMGHRIHEESETSKAISNNTRSQEDLETLELFWPKWMAKLLMRQYVKSQNSNN